MRIKEGFMLREIAGTWIVVPIGERVVEFNGLMTLSDSGALLWKGLEKDITLDGLVTSILDEYDVDEITAKADVEEFLGLVQVKGLMEQ